MVQDLSRKLKANQVLLVLVPNEIYMKGIRVIRKQLARNYKSICYVNLNKIYPALMTDLKKDKIEIGKFCFIDCITSTAMSPPAEKNCTFVGSPGDLTGLSISISETLQKHPEVLCFDSLSTLLIYCQGPVVARFVHDIIGKIRRGPTKAIFTALEEDTSSQMIRELGMFVDEVIHVK